MLPRIGSQLPWAASGAMVAKGTALPRNGSPLPREPNAATLNSSAAAVTPYANAAQRRRAKVTAGVGTTP
jgi:hypothetical protein